MKSSGCCEFSFPFARRAGRRHTVAGNYCSQLGLDCAAYSGPFTLLRCALTHSGLAPTAAIAATSCAVLQRNTAVQYLTSRFSLMLTRARSISTRSPRSMPFVNDNQVARSTRNVGRVRPVTVLPGHATICALDHELRLLVCASSRPRLTASLFRSCKESAR